MKALQKNWLSLNKSTCLTLLNQKTPTCLLVFLFCNISKGQTYANLVPNGSFETYTTCPNNSDQAFYASPWTGPSYNSSDYYNSCANPNKFGVPWYNGVSTPYPLYLPALNGAGYAGIYSYQPNYREYLEVPLTSTLELGICYYGEFYAVSGQIAKYVVNNIAGSFGNVKHPTNLSSGITLNLQQHIINYNNPIIKDTLNWQKVSGLYQANGTENYFTIGNFKDDSNTDTVNLYPPGSYWYYTSPAAYIFVDAVSVYSVNPTGNLPWSYRDTTLSIGDSVYIGNTMGGTFTSNWYTYGGTFINSGSGIYVKPVSTSTYVVQFTVCGVPRSDTLKVSVTGVGIKEFGLMNDELKISPNPNNGIFNLEILSKEFEIGSSEIKIINVLGQELKNIKLQSKKQQVNLEEFESGIYYLQFISKGTTISVKKIIKQ